MQSAIYINNRASSLIENDCFDKALDMLDQALAALQKSEQEEECEKTGGCSSDEYLSTSNRWRQELDGDMHSQPVYVSQIPPTEAHSVLSFVIHFNLALCHHLMALRAVEDKHGKLIGALQRYELATSIQMDGIFSVDTTYFSAIINNSAHIYEMLHRPRQAKQYRSEMVLSLTILMAREMANMVDDEFDGLFQNDTDKTLRKTTPEASDTRDEFDDLMQTASKQTLQKSRAAIAA